MMCLHVSVLPAPDSPDTTIDCDSPVARSAVNARLASAKTCGGCKPSDAPEYLSMKSDPYLQLDQVGREVMVRPAENRAAK
jgi:hypothetical protein